MNERKAIFINDVLKNIISVYFDTFFVFYFFKVANYEVLPLAKYYITLYLFIGLGFLLIRRPIKKNIKVPYFRIGISLQAIYIAMIMLLKEKIIDYVYLVGLIKGIADGFYHYPKNLLNTEKITNNNRQKFDGMLNIINKIFSIVIPLCLGILLTFFDYTSLGKIFFMLFIIMYIISFWIKDEEYFDKKFDIKGFLKLFKTNSKLRSAFIAPLLSGLTYSSGVMGTIITLSKIYNFKTNLNLGFVDSLCAALSLLMCVIYALKIKKEKFSIVLFISGIISFLSLAIYAFFPTRTMLIIYLLVRNSFITLINLLSSVIIVNYSNCKEIREKYKPEFYLVRDLIFSFSRCFGYLILLLVCLWCGKEYINYIMIIPALSLLIQCIVIGKLSTKILQS